LSPSNFTLAFNASLTPAITSPVISALQTASAQINTAGNTGSSRMQALAGARAAFNPGQVADVLVSSCDFLSRLYQAAPMKISKILTDNGSQLTDRFTGKTKRPSGKHAFDKRGAGLEIEHRLAPPRHPQTNVGWSSDSTLASQMSSGKRGSNSGPNIKQRSPATSRPTTTASHSVRSIINPPFRRCKSGVKTSQSCSKSG
jgi:hypothetical protein